MAAITAVTGIRPIVTHTGMDMDMVTMTLTTEATMVIIITIITGPVVYITEHVQGILQAEQQPPEIPLMQEI